MIALTLVVLVFVLALVMPRRWTGNVRGAVRSARSTARVWVRDRSALPRTAAQDSPSSAEPPDAEAATPASEAVPVPRGGTPEFGQSYTRGEIHAMLGGGTQSSLPHVGGRVVCGCFHPGLHPYAPYVVLPGLGAGVRRWAAVLAEQDTPVPCFLKRGANAWEYVGDFRAVAVSSDPDEIAEWEHIARREGDVSMVLHMEEAPVAVGGEGGGARGG